MVRAMLFLFVSLRLTSGDPKFLLSDLRRER
jgi:hypothetical protein